VIQAVISTNRLRYRELHENEAPIAMLAAQQAEINRDRKSRKKPFTIDEFFCYPSNEGKDQIDGIYGITAVELIRQRKFPSWALFVYKELAEAGQNAKSSKLPDILCYVSDDALLLAPQVSDSMCKCMLIATEAASNRIMHMESPCGKAIKAKIPEIRSKVVAIENCYIDIY